MTALRPGMLRLRVAAALFAGDLRAGDLRAGDLRAEDFVALFRAGPLALDFRALDFFALDFRALDFLAAFRALFIPPAPPRELREEDLRAGDLRPPDLPPPLVLPLFEPPRDDFLAAMLRAPMLGLCCDTIATSAHKKQQELSNDAQ